MLDGEIDSHAHRPRGRADIGGTKIAGALDGDGRLLVARPAGHARAGQDGRHRSDRHRRPPPRGARPPSRSAGAVGAAAGARLDIVQTPEPTAETLAAGVLLFDEHDRRLARAPPRTSRAGEFPGGGVEPGEAPARAGIREVAEETGIRLDDVPALLVVDWEPPAPPATAGCGGLRRRRLDAAEAARLLLPGPELRAWRFARGSSEATVSATGFEDMGTLLVGATLRGRTGSRSSCRSDCRSSHSGLRRCPP
ncbi:hypothetical protein SFUMM280S_04277 [Streptomyces fumanus]